MPLLIIFPPLKFSLAFIFILTIYCYDGQVMVQSRDTFLQPMPSGEATSQPKSPMNVNKDEANKALLKLNEDEL